MTNNSNYEKNAAALREVCPELLKWIEEQPDQDWLSQDGDQLHVSVGAVSHPMYDPVEPLKELSNIDSLPLHKENVSVFIGLGLGHTINRTCSKMEKGHIVVVIEPVGHMYRLAFNKYDFSEHIRSHALMFAPGRAEVDMLMGHLEAMKVVEDWLVFVDRTCSMRHEYFKLSEYAMEMLNQVQCNTGTVTSAGAKIADNDVATLPWVIRHRGVAELVSMFQGKPAICVSTGPSLARNIHLLRDVQDKAVIIAVGQALRPLLAYDIRPDFICTVDFGDVNMTHYAGLCDEDVPLVTINKTYAPLLKAYRGPKFISAGAHSVETTHTVLKDMGELPQGGSVAHMVFGLAANLGCDPIVFIGQDLALGEASHFGLADSSGSVKVEDGVIRWKIDDPRSPMLHAREDITMGPAQYVPGWWGQSVLTNTGLMTFITSMERLVSQCPAKVINCTEGGCHLEGTHRMFLADVIEKYCQQPVDKSALTPLLSLHPDADKRIETALPLLRKDLKVLDIIIENAEKGLAAALKVRNTKNRKKLEKLLLDNYKYSETANEGAKRLPPVGLAIYGVRRQIQSRKLNILQDKKHLLNNRKDLMTRIERNELVLTAARDAAKELKKSYQECDWLLSAYLTNNKVLEPTGETIPADISDAQHYLDSGNFAKPLLEARRILDDKSADRGKKDTAWEIMRKCYSVRDVKINAAKELQMKEQQEKKNLVPQYLDLLEESRKLGRDEDNMGKAVEALRKAITLLPDREEARWGLASALLHLGQYDEALGEYADLCLRFPNNHRFRFEYGQVLILTGDVQRGVLNIREAMSKSDEFNHFFGALAKLYHESGLHDEARQAAEYHVQKFPHDKDVKELLKKLNVLRDNPAGLSQKCLVL